MPIISLLSLVPDKTDQLATLITLRDEDGQSPVDQVYYRTDDKDDEVHRNFLALAKSLEVTNSVLPTLPSPAPSSVAWRTDRPKKPSCR